MKRLIEIVDERYRRNMKAAYCRGIMGYGFMMRAQSKLRQRLNYALSPDVLKSGICCAVLHSIRRASIMVKSLNRLMMPVCIGVG